MSRVNYFKAQAKKLFKDYKTRASYTDEVDGRTSYSYSPTYFDIDRIFLEFDWDEESFTLMKAQHVFALLVGFRKWGDLVAVKWSTKTGHRVKALKCHNEVNDDNRNENETGLYGRLQA